MSKVHWIADAAHSEVGFRVKHLMITNVKGRFTDFSVDALTEGEDFSQAEIRFSANLASVDTGNAQRDGHLRSGDFFDVEHHPEMTFQGRQITDYEEDGEFKLHGDLTIRGISRPVTLEVEFMGVAKDPYGNSKAGFNISGKINRKDWDLHWNVPMEAGGLLVSEEVKIQIDLQLMKKY
jgi:polyisoprenoid-binding protein YceI